MRLLGPVVAENWIVALIAAAPGVLALLLRRKSITIRAESEAGKSRLTEFTVLYQEARQQVLDCRTECQRLTTTIREAEKREQALELRVETLEDQVRSMTAEADRLRGENAYLNRLVQRLSNGGAA